MNTESLKFDQANRLIFLGVLLFLLGLLVGLIIPVLANPRMGLSSHLEGVMNGMFLIILGSIWNRISLSPKWLKITFWMAIYGTFVNWFGILFAAIFDAGEMLGIAAEGNKGTPLAEGIVTFSLLSLTVAMLFVCVALLIGLRRNMKNHSIPLLLVITLCLSCGPEKTGAIEDAESDFDKFTGRWYLHIVESQQDSTSSWEPRQDHYKNRQGFILYDGIEGMGVHHVTENYQDYEFEGKGSLDSLTHKDLRHLADNFVYFGSYKVNESDKTIEHYIKSANFQRMWGTIAKRKYEFKGDTLMLYPLRDKYPKTRLKWIKVSRSDK